MSVVVVMAVDPARAEALRAILDGAEVLCAPADGGLWDLLEERAPALVIVGVGGASDLLEALRGLSSVVVVGPDEPAQEERWLQAGALEYVADPLEAASARLHAACRRATELAELRSHAGRLAAMVRLALEPPSRSGVFVRLGTELEGLGLPLAWQGALPEGDGWRAVPGRWPDSDAWEGPLARADVQMVASGRDLVLPLGAASGASGVLRVRLEANPNRDTVGVLAAIAALVGGALVEPSGPARLRGDDDLGAALHELRGPLTAVLGQGQLIERGILAPVEASVRDAAEIIVAQARRLRGLIDAMEPRQH